MWPHRDQRANAKIPPRPSVQQSPSDLHLGYLPAGSTLIETVFSWPGTGFRLNAAIFQRDLPLLQGTILVLALFFVFLNLIVDIAQAAIDPRIKRS